MLAINLGYLYLAGSLTLRLQRVRMAGAADALSEASLTSLVLTLCLERFWLCRDSCEAFLLPFWEGCRAFAALRASCWRACSAAFSAISASLATLAASCAICFLSAIFSLYSLAAFCSSAVSAF
jgi:hypothetical protein